MKGKAGEEFTVWSDMIANEMTPEEVAESKAIIGCYVNH